MKVTYDKDAGATYVYLSKQRINHTKRISDNVFIDIDDRGKVVGIELLDTTRPEVKVL